MQFRAQWGIYTYPKRFSEPVPCYKSKTLTFEKESVRSAKTHVTKLVKADPNMQELKADKWGLGPYAPKWDAWSEVGNYLHQTGVRYSCRRSRTEFESSDDPQAPSIAIQAKIYLHWKEADDA